MLWYIAVLVSLTYARECTTAPRLTVLRHCPLLSSAKLPSLRPSLSYSACGFAAWVRWSYHDLPPPHSPPPGFFLRYSICRKLGTLTTQRPKCLCLHGTYNFGQKAGRGHDTDSCTSTMKRARDQREKKKNVGLGIHYTKLASLAFLSWQPREEGHFILGV